MNPTQERQGTMLEPSPAMERTRWLPLVGFFFGSGVSFTGDVLTLLAIPWFVLQTTGSVEKTGITAFCSTLPTVLAAFFGSTIVDRLGFKRTSVIGDMASAVSVALIPLLYSTVGLAFWQLLTLVFLGGLLKSPGATARSALVPDIATQAGMPLERANAFSDGMSRLAGFLGAPLAGVLIVVIGTSNLLWFDAASFLISALAIGLAVLPTPPLLSHTEGARDAGQEWARLGDGLRFIRSDALIVTLLLTVMITNLLDGALSAVVEPAYIRQVFHSALPFGLLIAAFGGGTFVGTLIFSAVGQRLPRRLTLGIGFTISGAIRFWILLIPILPLLIVVHAIAGIAGGGINPILRTMLQERVPVALRARVFGATTAAVLIGVPLGTAISGYVMAWFGADTTLVAMGALYFVATASLLVNPTITNRSLRGTA